MGGAPSVTRRVEYNGVVNIWDVRRQSLQTKLNANKHLKGVFECLLIGQNDVQIFHSKGMLTGFLQNLERSDISIPQNVEQSKLILSKGKLKTSFLDYYPNKLRVTKNYSNIPDDWESDLQDRALIKFFGNEDCLVQEFTPVNDLNDLEGDYGIFYYSLNCDTESEKLDIISFCLKRIQEKVTATCVISTNELSAPFVFEENALVEFPEFHAALAPDCSWGGQLYVGTDDGNCYVCDFTVGESNQAQVSHATIFKCGKPCEDTTGKTVKNQSVANTTVEFQSVEDKSFLSLQGRFKFSVMDCKRFLKENLEVVVIMEHFDSDMVDQYRYFVYARRPGRGPWSKAEFYANANTSTNTYKFKFLRVSRMGGAGDDRACRMYLACNKGLALVSFDRGSGELCVSKLLQKKVTSSNLDLYSGSTRLFYIPIENIVEVWNESLTAEIYTVLMGHRIKKTFLVDDQRFRTLIIYDEANYSELDLDRFEFRQVVSLGRSADRPTLALPFNLELFPEHKEFQVPYYTENLVRLRPVNEVSKVTLLEFSILEFFKCFSEHNNRPYVAKYAEHYFAKIAEFDFVDCTFGPLSPLHLAIYHNDVGQLKRLLAKHRYPKSTFGYDSPLAFAFKLKRNSAFKVICEHLVGRDYAVHFSRLDFQLLLRAPADYCQRLLETVLLENRLSGFPKTLCLEGDSRIHFYSDIKQCLAEIRRTE